MAASNLFDVPTIVRLQQVVANFRGGGLLLPDFQRPFVWDDDRRRQLFDSILKGLPIGSLLIWRTTAKIATKRELEGFRLPAPTKSEQARNYLLDGQQRVFTLFAALSGEVSAGESERRWPIYLDLEADRSSANGEARFRLARRDKSPPVTWLPLSVAFDTRRLFAHQRALEQAGKADLVDRIEEVANILRDYPLALVPILTDDLDLATESFQRVNSAGSSMSEAHMLRALTYSDTFDFSERFAAIAAELPGAWAQLDEQVFVNTLKALLGLSIYRTEMSELKEALAKSPELLDSAGAGIQRAARFACDRLKVLGPAALPYAYQFVALAFAATRGADLDARAEPLVQWFWATAYAEQFTGMTAGQLRGAFDHVLAICAGGPALPAELPRTCPPLEKFRLPSVRSLLLMHRLAAQLGDEGPLLVARGSEAFGQLRRGHADDPANRILVAPERLAETRRDLFQDTDPRGDELRDRHLFPPHSDPAWLTTTGSAARGDRSPDLSKVLDWRRHQLRRLDSDFIHYLGFDDEA